jgi:hypothetical protein
LDNSQFKENFLIEIDGYYYKIEEIDGTTITLAGYPQDWMTLTAGGTAVRYQVLQYTKDTVETRFVVFNDLGRDGKDPVVREIASTETEDVAIVALSFNGNDVQDLVGSERTFPASLNTRTAIKKTFFKEPMFEEFDDYKSVGAVER